MPSVATACPVRGPAARCTSAESGHRDSPSRTAVIEEPEPLDEESIEWEPRREFLLDAGLLDSRFQPVAAAVELGLDGDDESGDLYLDPDWTEGTTGEVQREHLAVLVER